MTRRDNWTAAALFALLFWVVLAVGAMDAEDAELERDHYCRMVQVYEQTGGEYGWPDYGGVSESECNQGSSK
jgi:hypothetical protein